MTLRKNLGRFAYGLLAGLIIFAIVLGIAGMKALITSFVIKENVISYSQKESIFADRNSAFPIHLEGHPARFDLSSFMISGNIAEGSKIKVYLENPDKRKFLIYDSSKRWFSITTSSINEFEKIQNESAEESAEQEPEQTEQPTEQLEGQAENQTEQPIAQLPESQPPSSENQTMSNESSDDAGQENIENAPLPIFPSPSPAEDKGQIKEEKQAISGFSLECEDTCDMRSKGFDKEDYSLIVEIEYGSVRIEEISYELIDLTPKIPKIAGFEVDPMVYEMLERGNARVIIELKENQNINQKQSEVLSALEVSDTSTLQAGKDFRIMHKYENIGAIAGEIDADGLMKLSKNENIKRIYLDPVLQIILHDSAPMISATSAWQRQMNGINVTGKGETVCIIDTGTDYNHPALSGKVTAQKCYCSISGSPGCCPNGNTTDDNALDNNGHGTHVAGIVASADSFYRGIAPDANLVAVKTCDASGYCAGSDIIAGIEFCNQNSQAYNISAISISIGGLSYSSYCDSVSAAMTAAINNAAGKGIIVSIAAGNSGYNNKIAWPACVQNATAVSAVDKSDIIGSYSNRAAITDLMAPGGSSTNAITSSLYGGFGGKYGTSMAAPHVSGAAALLQQYSRLYNSRALSAGELENILRKNGKQIYDSATNMTYYRMDIDSSMNAILKINESEKSVERANAGKVIFSDAVDFSSASDAFVISPNLISLDSAKWPQFNKPARLILHNLAFEKTPVVLKDNVMCGDCSVISYANGTFDFNVPGFSNYSAGANSILEIWDSADYGMPYYSGNSTLNKDALFFSNYSSRTGEISSGNCSISFSNSNYQMNFSPAKSLFEFQRNFSSEGDYSYEIICMDSSFESMNMSGAIAVSKPYPVMALKLNGIESNLSVLRGVDVIMNATLLEPDGNISLYLNSMLINSGKSVMNAASFSDYGLNNVTASYNGSNIYQQSSKTSWISVIEDSAAPEWSDISVSYGRYGESNSVSIKWADNIAVSSVWIENDFSRNLFNYSAADSGNGAYSYRFSGLSAKNYSYRWFANDSSGNLNMTDMLAYEVQKADNPVRLYLNGQQSSFYATYGNQITASADGKGDVRIFRDNALISNPDASIPDAKTSGYAYFANASGDENHSANQAGVTWYAFVNKSSSNLKLRLNSQNSDISTSDKNVRITADLITPSFGNVKIYKGSTLLASGSSVLEKEETFAAGIYAINASFDGTANYLPASNSLNLVITSSTQTQTSMSSSSGNSEGAGTGSKSSCLESWQCSAWSACINGEQTRTCSDLNICGTALDRPESKRICSACIEKWNCSEFSECRNGTKSRECFDLNKCGTTVSKNATIQNCSGIFPFFQKLGLIEKLKSFYSLTSNSIKKLSKDAYSEMKQKPIIILPLAAVMASLIIAVVSKIRFLNVRVKRMKSLNHLIKNTVKNEMRHIRKRH